MAEFESSDYIQGERKRGKGTWVNHSEKQYLMKKVPGQQTIDTISTIFHDFKSLCNVVYFGRPGTNLGCVP